MSQIYYDAEGNEISLYKLVRQEPDWAMSRVQVSREQAEEIEGLKLEVSAQMDKVDELWQQKERAEGTLAIVHRANEYLLKFIGERNAEIEQWKQTCIRQQENIVQLKHEKMVWNEKQLLAEARIKELEQALRDRSSERDTAIGMLADWCVAVELNGASWDDWDEHYKNASFRPCGIRDLLDVAIYERKPMERKQ